MADGQAGGLQRHAYIALHSPGSRRLSWPQRLSASVILLSACFSVLTTEPAFAAWLGSTTSVVEFALAAFFVTEYGIRLWAIGADSRYKGAAGRVRYALTPFALLDLISIIPYFVGLGTQSFLFRLLRLFRLLALSRLVRYSAAMRLVLRSIYERRHELAFTLSLAGLMILVSASVLYSVEADAQPEAFGSIPRALWWSVSTLTTVGYGDVVPTTALGRLFAALTALSGIGLIAMPTGILSAAFSEASRKNSTTKHHTPERP